MTNQEAISKLRQMKNYYHFESFAKDSDYKIEALDLAIKALEFVDKNCPKTFINYLNGRQILGR